MYTVNTCRLQQAKVETENSYKFEMIEHAHRNYLATPVTCWLCAIDKLGNSTRNMEPHDCKKEMQLGVEFENVYHKHLLEQSNQTDYKVQ